MITSLDEAFYAVREFNRMRPGWKQVHTPKNLAMAVASEAGEILSILRWTESSTEPDVALIDQLEGEIADVAIFLFALADACGISLSNVIEAKLEFNSTRYPPG